MSPKFAARSFSRNRFYSPDTGRFISSDPLGMVDGPNTYGFCGGDPVNRSDPMGTAWWVMIGNTAVAGPFRSEAWDSVLYQDPAKGSADAAAKQISAKWNVDARAVYIPEERERRNWSLESGMTGEEARSRQVLLSENTFYWMQDEINKVKSQAPILTELNSLGYKPINENMVAGGEFIVTMSVPIGEGVEAFCWCVRQGGKLVWETKAAQLALRGAKTLPGTIRMGELLMRGGRYAKDIVESALELIPGQIEQQFAREAAARKALGSGTLITAGSVNKAAIVKELGGTTAQAQRVADAIADGRIQVSILQDEMFEKAYQFRGGRSAEGVVAFAYGEKIYLRGRSNSIFTDSVHEGTHALDHLAGHPGSDLQLEKRAFFFERQFEIGTGRSVTFSTLKEMLEFIHQNYTP